MTIPSQPRTSLTRAVALCAGVLISVSGAKAQDLLADTDLPGVPISITDGKRKPISAGSSENTQAVREQAKKERQRRRDDIRRMGAEAHELLASADDHSANNASRTSSPAKERVDEIKQSVTRIKAKGNGEEEATRITVKPGVNRLVRISRGHPNRVVVPFEQAQIRTTTSDAEVTAKGPVIYVATHSNRPVTLFVSPKGNERVAISLTLMPKPIAPQEIQVELDTEFSQQFKFANPTAEKWEERNSYVDTLIEVFEALARQDIPRGYSLRSPLPTDFLTCWAGEDVNFEIGQVVDGHNIEVQILVAENNADQPIEIVGSMCAGDRVMAAAEWPRSVLEPNQKTEVYVARHRLDEAEQERSRPSLINDGE